MSTVKELIGTATLEGIDVVRCLWERAHPVTRGPLTWPPQLDQHLNVSVATPTPVPAGGAAFLCLLQVKWCPSDAPLVVVASAEVQLRVAYRFADASVVLAPDVAKEFGRDVALHHAWPFLRHRLQQVCMELGINAALLPLKQLPDANKIPAEVVAKESE